MNVFTVVESGYGYLTWSVLNGYGDAIMAFYSLDQACYMAAWWTDLVWQHSQNVVQGVLP